MSDSLILIFFPYAKKIPKIKPTTVPITARRSVVIKPLKISLKFSLNKLSNEQKALWMGEAATRSASNA